ncbi:MAG: 3',5'-cyclic-nucleotide phosphodiesterase [Ginsengibacter sp.]
MKRVLVFLSIIISGFSFAQRTSVFKVVPLGVRGGADESNLSCYMLKGVRDKKYITLDAGTLYSGIQKSISLNALKGTTASIIKDSIVGYLISHAHLDHIAGMILNSPDDVEKPVYALPSVIKILKEKYFTWSAWANFGNEGETPRLNKYSYNYLNESEMPLQNTGLFVKTFSLSHGPGYESTAFLIRKENDYLLYMGDTGADEIEHSDKLSKLWRFIAPLIESGNLKAIMIEVSFPDEQSDSKLFGHLKPGLYYSEMEDLAKYASVKQLRKIPIVITHIKPSSKGELVIPELKKQNNMGLQLMFPVQGHTMNF